MAIVELKNISKIYQQGDVQVKAVDNVSLSIDKGDFAVLCGPSGSGKTSILNLIGGLDKASFGEVWLEGVELASLSNTDLADLEVKLKEAQSLRFRMIATDGVGRFCVCDPN